MNDSPHIRRIIAEVLIETEYRRCYIYIGMYHGMTVSKDGLSGLLLIGPQVIIVLAQCRIGIDNHVVTKMIRIGTVLPDNFRSKLIVRHTKRLQDMLDRSLR